MKFHASEILKTDVGIPYTASVLARTICRLAVEDLKYTGKRVYKDRVRPFVQERLAAVNGLAVAAQQEEPSQLRVVEASPVDDIADQRIAA
jgi:hypothetical protein